MSNTLKKPNSIPAAIAAIRTLEVLGYTYSEVDQAWNTPLRKHPAHIDRGLMSRMGQQALDGNFWVYQGDGEDHLESLTCPVVIDARRLKGAIDNCNAYGIALQKIGSALDLMPGCDIGEAALTAILKMKTARHRDPEGSYRDATGELVLPRSMCKGWPHADVGGEQ
jgi:hypothetical protein